MERIEEEKKLLEDIFNYDKKPEKKAPKKIGTFKRFWNWCRSWFRRRQSRNRMFSGAVVEALQEEFEKVGRLKRFWRWLKSF